MFNLPPLVEEAIFSALIVFLITISYRFLANQKEMKQIKIDLKEKQSKIKELQKTNPQEANKVLEEVMDLSRKQFRINMKPMMVTLIVVGLILPAIGAEFSGIIINIPFPWPSFLRGLVSSEGWIRPWLAWYILVSVPIGYMFRKIMGVEM
jgi:uncharacterized membrane protein (DUF106 family)